MRTKQLFTIRLLSFAALCTMALAAVSCASEDVAQNGKEADNDKNFTEFVGGRPETRTTMDYNDGAFYWEAGDKIYVQDDNNVWQVSNNAPNGKVASFKFKVPGKFTDKASYKVYYPGKNGTDNNVTIQPTQNQTEPNSTAHFGVSGDCGTADAARVNKFHFTLDHQAAILVFQPYNSNAELNDCYLTKVEVTSNDNITGTYTLNPSTGELTGAGTGKEITLNTTGSGAYAHGLPVKTKTANVETNGAYMLIQPGTHALKVRYWVKDVLTNVEAVMTKDLSSFAYDKNTFYDMALNMNLKDYETTYCHWDAKVAFWAGHEWNAANLADRWQPVATTNPYLHASELVNPPATSPRAANMSFTGTGSRIDAVNLCKDCPNANELAWYAEKGDPRFDADILWTSMGHLRKGGLWLKKKAKMASDNGTTVANIESLAPDNTDWRIGTPSKSKNITITNLTSPSTSEISNYLFLPALGNASGDISFSAFFMTGDSGSFWASSAHDSGDNNATFALTFGEDNSQIKLQVLSDFGRKENIMNAWKFE